MKNYRPRTFDRNHQGIAKSLEWKIAGSEDIHHWHKMLVLCSHLEYPICSLRSWRDYCARDGVATRRERRPQSSRGIAAKKLQHWPANPASYAGYPIWNSVYIVTPFCSVRRYFKNSVQNGTIREYKFSPEFWRGHLKKWCVHICPHRRSNVLSTMPGH